MYTFLSGVVDNDHKGESGVGTIFCLKIFNEDVLEAKHEYGLLDLINNKFDPIEVKKPYQKLNELEEREIKAKAVSLPPLKKIITNPDGLAIIESIVSTNTKAIVEIKAGKEKALNNLVGKILAAAKQAGTFLEPAAVKDLLVERCK